MCPEPLPTATDPSLPAIDVRRLRVSYGEVTALDGLDFQLRAGLVCAVVGMNGSGKSTLFNTLMGLVRPLSGEVRVLGVPSDQARARNLVAYVPQTDGVDWHFPIDVRSVVTQGRFPHMGVLRRPRQADHRAVDGALERVGLEDLGHRPLSMLSGGQRKRVFVARGIAQEAPVLLLDEPFAGVDQASQRKVSAALRQEADRGRTVLVSTHDLPGVEDLCDEALVMNRRTIAHGPPAEALTPANLSLAFGLHLKE